jgi:hypothetical protein
MVGTHSGLHGVHVQSHVEVDHKTEADHVQVQPHNMVVLNALEPVHKPRVATPTTVQVRHLFNMLYVYLCIVIRIDILSSQICFHNINIIALEFHLLKQTISDYCPFNFIIS